VSVTARPAEASPNATSTRGAPPLPMGRHSRLHLPGRRSELQTPVERCPTPPILPLPTAWSGGNYATLALAASTERIFATGVALRARHLRSSQDRQDGGHPMRPDG
jgi:hypothetical protein